MAAVQIADIYEPLTFNQAVDEKAIELNAFLQSGCMVNDPALTEQAAAGGRIGDLPFDKALATDTEPNYSSDDPASFSVPVGSDTSLMKWRLAAMNESWSTMNLTRELALWDPLTAIVNRVAKWWATQIEKRVISTFVGVYNDNVDADSSDMVNSIYSDVVAGSITAAMVISAEAVIDTQQTAGDHQEVFTAIAMHSVTYSNLKKQNLIDFIPDARGEVMIPFYLGMRVVYDDSMPVIAGTNSPMYITILFAQGVLRNGQGRNTVPSELERLPSAGDGGGQDILYYRRNEIIHPHGISFVSASVSAESATLAELELATNWTRVMTRKNVGVAFLAHNN